MWIRGEGFQMKMWMEDPRWPDRGHDESFMEENGQDQK